MENQYQAGLRLIQVFLSLKWCANLCVCECLLQKVALSFDFNEFDDEQDDEDELSGNISSHEDCAELDAGTLFCSVSYVVFSYACCISS